MPIIAGALAPHPPHLVYAENPPQNEPRSECGWETLRWGYERMRKDILALEPDAIVVLSPHWQTYIGTHFLAVPQLKSRSVDPVFPNLFRYNYDMQVDVDLAKELESAAKDAGLVTALMENPDFRVDYGTIVSCHLLNPAWDIPIVGMSSCRNSAFYSIEVMQEQAMALGKATREVLQASKKRVVLVSSNSLSHRHFVRESDIPEDMSKEHIMHHGQYLWDMRMIELMKAGKSREIVDMMPEFTTQAISETDAGAMTWMLSAMDFPTQPAEVYAYGSVIGTGNAVVSWLEPESKRKPLKEFADSVQWEQLGQKIKEGAQGGKFLEGLRNLVDSGGESTRSESRSERKKTPRTDTLPEGLKDLFDKGLDKSLVKPVKGALKAGVPEKMLLAAIKRIPERDHSPQRVAEVIELTVEAWQEYKA